MNDPDPSSVVEPLDASHSHLDTRGSMIRRSYRRPSPYLVSECKSTSENHCVGLARIQLLLKNPSTFVYLDLSWHPISRSLAFDLISDEELISTNIGLSQHPIENPSSWPNEGAPVHHFLVSWVLPDQNQLGSLWVSFGEDGAWLIEEGTPITFREFAVSKHINQTRMISVVLSTHSIGVASRPYTISPS